MRFFGSNNQAYYDNAIGYLHIFKAGNFFPKLLCQRNRLVFNETANCNFILLR